MGLDLGGRDKSYALTPAQIPFWTYWLRFPDSVVETVFARIEWKTEIDVEVFSAAFDYVVATNDSLRLVFRVVDGEPRQSVADAAGHREKLEYRDFSNDIRPEEAAHAWLDEIGQRALDLTKCCFSAVLAKVSEKHWLFQLNASHATFDQKSKALVIERLDKAYRCIADGKELKTGDEPSFVDYITQVPQNWKPVRVSSSTQARLTPSLRQTPGVFDKPLASVKRARDIGPRRARELRRMVGVAPEAQNTADLTSVLDGFLAVTMVLLSRLSSETRVTIGTMSHGRFDKECAGVVGQFVRQLPISVELEEDWGWEELLKAVRKSRFAAFRKAVAGREVEAPPLTTSLNFIPEAMPPFLGVPSHSVVAAVLPDLVGRDCSIRVEASDSPDDFNLVILMTQAVEDSLQGLDLHDLWGRLLDDLGAGLQIGQIALGGEKELHQARVASKHSHDAPSPQHTSLVSAFLSQVAENPHAIAIKDRSRQVSFLQVEQQSRQIAGALVKRGIKQGDLVAIALPRSAELIAAILGVLRAGAGYYCIDQHLPAKLVASNLKELNAPLLLNRDGSAPAGAGSTPVIATSKLSDEGAQTSVEELPEINSGAPMYVMFTSGSTGRPKGVLVPHESFMRSQEWTLSVLQGDQGGSVDWGLCTSLAFETAYRGFLALQTGGTLFCYDAPDNLTGVSLVHALEDDKCNGLTLTPSFLRLVVKRKWKTQRLKYIVSIGEPLPSDLAEQAFKAFPGVTLFNFYGPTESTMAVTAHRYNPVQDQGATVPIGKPPEDAVIHVLDKELKAVPRGVPGELAVGGQRLAIGYLNRPELNKERYIDDPFHDGGRVYLTGDIGFVNSQGNLVHLGRNDDQIKINGLRVETGEVEAALSLCHGIEDCAVVAVRDTIEKAAKLIAFYVASQDIEPSEVRNKAGTILARALLPKAYIRVGRIPHTQSGKTDRQALMDMVPEGVFDLQTGLGEAPKGAAETELANIWCDILGQEAISRDDDFFELGGDSLSFVNMVLSVEHSMGIKLPVEAMGSATTLRDIAQFVSVDEARGVASEESHSDFVSRTKQQLGTIKFQAKRMLGFVGLRATGEDPELNNEVNYSELPRLLKVATRDWSGEQIGQSVPVMLHNAEGNEIPLVWCFNGRNEPDALAERFAPQRPVYALRSLNGIVSASARQSLEHDLVRDYANELEMLIPSGPFYIGGNCQAARIATELALEITRRGREVARLCILEHVPAKQLPFSVSLIFGRDSMSFNPFLQEDAPQHAWKERFADVTWDIVAGRHGEFFRPGRIEELSATIEKRLTRENRCNTNRESGLSDLTG